MIDQVRGAFGYPAAAATRTEAAPLARKRDEAVQAARCAPEPREPAGQPAALQKVSELLFDKPRRLERVLRTPPVSISAELPEYWNAISSKLFTGTRQLEFAWPGISPSCASREECDYKSASGNRAAGWWGLGYTSRNQPYMPPWSTDMRAGTPGYP